MIDSSRIPPTSMMPISVQHLLTELIYISEKAAQISRICRTKNDELFGILIQEKSNESKNPRFIHDFKTFADVLIQEVAKFCLELKFPGLSKQVYGEETNHFKNKLGESVTVQIKPDMEGTIKMLAKILNGNLQTAHTLAEVIYQWDQSSVEMSIIIEEKLCLEQSDIAIWIDPIDSTSEYIHGQWHRMTNTVGEAWSNQISPHGLHCVTCLFGVFDAKTGCPLMGILNQPFYQLQSCEQDRYVGRCIWGFNIKGVCQNNLGQLFQSDIDRKSTCKLVLIGNKESEDIKRKLNSISQTMYVAGAGYKLLCVSLGLADLLVTSSKTTYFWDTCAGHAILRSLGGGIIALEDILHLSLDDEQYDLERLQIKYRAKYDPHSLAYSHSKGLVAYHSPEIMQRVIQILNSS